MPKKTARKTPKNSKALSHPCTGLVAKAHQAKEPAKKECALDTHSHRTLKVVP
jgi:hypothetical protein